jgi:polyhydroxyalkanoate synthesis regulator phasin
MVEHLEQQLAALAANYEKVEAATAEREERMAEMTEYITELEEQCQAFQGEA